MLKDHNALRTVTDLVTEHIQTTFSDIDAIVGKFKVYMTQNLLLAY